MKKYTIQSYVPEENLFHGKDARFCRTAFEDAFVLDVHEAPTIIASCKGDDKIAFSMAQSASLLNIFKGDKEVLILPYPHGGSLLVYPAWPHLEMALAFLVKESAEEVEKAHKIAQRHAFSAFLTTEETNPNATAETKLCVLDFYMKQLFSKECQTNQAAQILMLANLLGCRLHEMSVLSVNATLDEHELERLSAYLACTFMTMRRRAGEVTAAVEKEENTANNAHVLQEYGIRIQQNTRKKIKKEVTREASIAHVTQSFNTHPAFQSCQTNESDDAIHVHIPLRQKATLSSFAPFGYESEMVLTIFPLG